MADNPEQTSNDHNAEGPPPGEEEKLEKTRMDIGAGASPHDPTLRDMDVKTMEEITLGEGRSFGGLASGLLSRWRQFRFAPFGQGSAIGRILQFLITGSLILATLGTFLLLFLTPAAADPLLNRLWVFLLTADFFLVLTSFPRSWAVRLPMLLFFLLGIAALVAGEMKGVPLRAGWLGAGPFAFIPLFWLQPVYVVFEVVLPAAFLFLVGNFLFERDKKGRGLLLVLALIAVGLQTVTAFLLFHRADVPSLASFIPGDQPPIGSAGLEAADREIVLKTVGFPKGSPGDERKRLYVSLQNFRTAEKKKDPDRGPGASLDMSVSDADHNPVMFLGRDDFELEMDGRPIAFWKLDRVGVGYRIEIPSLPTQAARPAAEKEEKKALPKELKLLSPREGDSFRETLSAVADVFQGEVLSPDSYRVRFLLDGAEIGRSDSLPYQFTSDTAPLPSGSHKLRVEAYPVSGPGSSPLIAEVSLQKSEASSIDFARPPFGKFLSPRETIEVVPAVEGATRSLELFVDGNELHRIDVPPFLHEWDTSDLLPGRHLLTARATGEDGATVSDWVLVSTGEAGLRVQSDLHDKTTTAADRIVLVIDASLSQLDVWDSRSKWDWQKKAILDPKVLGRVALAKGGLIGVGTRSSPTAANCRDAAWLVKPADRPAQAFKEALGDTEPKGVSSPLAGIALALEWKIDRVLFVTDGWRPCSELKGSDLAKKLKQQGIGVDGIALGTIDPKEGKGMEEFLASAGGHLSLVENGSALVSTLEDLLTPSFQILDGEKTVLKGPLDGGLHRLKPGEYKLSFPQGMGLGPERIILQNGFVQMMTIRSGEGEKPFLDSSVEKL